MRQEDTPLFHQTSSKHLKPIRKQVCRPTDSAHYSADDKKNLFRSESGKFESKAPTQE